MKRDNPLPFLYLLLLLVMFSVASSAQTLTDKDSAAQSEALKKEVRRIDRLTEHGPHAKNKLAGGRLLVLNRAVPNLPDHYSPAKLFGPAYKNRRVAIDRPEVMVFPQAQRSSLTGPRYKNRNAKSRRQ